MDLTELKEGTIELPEKYAQASNYAEGLRHRWQSEEIKLDGERARQFLIIKAQGKFTADEMKARVEDAVTQQRLTVLEQETNYRKAKIEADNIMLKIEAVRELSAFMRKEMGVFQGVEPEKRESKF